MVMPLVERARQLATEWHYRQTRKYTGAPYIVHPAEVVELVQSVHHDEGMLCAAWLHDVVEDTGCPLELVYQIFGRDVAELVNELTKADRLQPGAKSRVGWHMLNLQKLAQISTRAKTIKLADTMSNCKDIVRLDPMFAPIYLQEKFDSLSVLVGGDPLLWQRAWELIVSETQKLL